VITWTLCSIPEPRRALKEVRRFLKEGGRLIFVEHGHSPDRGVATWQDKLTPVWRRISGGCHLNRKIDDLVASAGFHIPRIGDQLSSWATSHDLHIPGCRGSSSALMLTLTEALIALLPTGILLAGSTVMCVRERRPWSVIQLVGAAGMLVVAFSHVCEALQILPWMRLGQGNSVGHFLDLFGAIIAVTLFPLGFLLHAHEMKRDTPG
jgi:SAM-dependent methyltransferase